MHFLPDVYVPCEVCKGTRYNRETLEVRYKGKNIYEVLDMTVEEAHGVLPRTLPTHLTQARDAASRWAWAMSSWASRATTLSGGEAQRVKLATELSRTATGQARSTYWTSPRPACIWHDVRQA